MELDKQHGAITTEAIPFVEERGDFETLPSGRRFPSRRETTWEALTRFMHEFSFHVVRRLIAPDFKVVRLPTMAGLAATAEQTVESESRPQDGRLLDS